MTKIVISDEPNGVVNLTAYDHALGSAQVCAGISALFYTLEGWLINHPESVKNHTSNLESGYAYIEFEPLDEKVRVVLGAIILGLKQIEKTYGNKFIKIVD